MRFFLQDTADFIGFLPLAKGTNRLHGVKQFLIAFRALPGRGASGFKRLRSVGCISPLAR